LRVADKANLNLRAEAINVLNGANFGFRVDYVDVRNTGQILSADPDRTIQLGLRVRF
jgi:hypothetical protein